MKSLILSLSILFASLQVSATSLHPCTPMVQAMPTNMYCNDGAVHYSIRIETLMSPAIPMCSGENHYEIHSATVVVSNGVAKQTLQLQNDEFSYTFSTFVSPKANLNLKNCLVPPHGGFSVGN